jgi:hypothetical protein
MFKNNTNTEFRKMPERSDFNAGPVFSGFVTVFVFKSNNPQKPKHQALFPLRIVTCLSFGFLGAFRWPPRAPGVPTSDSAEQMLSMRGLKAAACRF